MRACLDVDGARTQSNGHAPLRHGREMMQVRVATLLPSATEIVCALGARSELVGRSHECDHPQDLGDVPVLTRARVGPLPSSKAIDAGVRAMLADALAIYEVDLDRLKEAGPDVIVTQDLCDVCAVSFDDVRAAVARLARADVRIVNLHPTKLEEIWADIARVAEALGRAEDGRTLVERLRARVARIEERALDALREVPRPTTLTIEWIDPVMVGGLWMPELVALAGGEALVTKPADHAPTLTRAQLAELDPDVVIVKPCGFTLERTLLELSVLEDVLPWRSWRAVVDGKVFVADGNAFFNRSGPRIVESLEIMAACVHPDAFRDFARAHRESYVRVDRDMVIHR